MYLLMCWTVHLWPYLLPFTHQLRSDQSRYWSADSQELESAGVQTGRKLTQKLPRWSEIPYSPPQIIPTVNTSYAKHILWLCFYGGILTFARSGRPSTLERSRHAILTLLKAPANALSSSSCLLVVSVPRLSEYSTCICFQLQAGYQTSGALTCSLLSALAPQHASTSWHHQCTLQHRGPVPIIQLGIIYFDPSLSQNDSIWIDSFESEWFVWKWFVWSLMFSL